MSGKSNLRLSAISNESDETNPPTTPLWLTVKLFMAGNKRRSHVAAPLLHQLLKLHLALLVELVFHVGCAAGVSLRTDAQVLT